MVSTLKNSLKLELSFTEIAVRHNNWLRDSSIWLDPRLTSAFHGYYKDFCCRKAIKNRSCSVSNVDIHLPFDYSYNLNNNLPVMKDLRENSEKQKFEKSILNFAKW